jgi:excisionase family DNA binding protein
MKQILGQNYYSVAEAAEMLSITRQTLHNWILEGRGKLTKRTHGRRSYVLTLDEIRSVAPEE